MQASVVLAVSTNACSMTCTLVLFFPFVRFEVKLKMRFVQTKIQSYICYKSSMAEIIYLVAAYYYKSFFFGTLFRKLPLIISLFLEVSFI